MSMCNNDLMFRRQNNGGLSHVATLMMTLFIIVFIERRPSYLLVERESLHWI